MNTVKQHLVPLAIGVVLASLSGCGWLAANTQEFFRFSPAVATDTHAKPLFPEESVANKQSNTNVDQQNNLNNTSTSLTLNIYRVDNQCNNLESEAVQVRADGVVDAVVNKVLEQATSSDFDVAGYRVRVNAQSGVANIDLRLVPDSRRKFVSLSTCEQLALFGGLRRTLTNNSQLKIKDVRFTEQGQKIYL
ncbi:MAG: sporulation/spore germination protein [Symploca sp. SIO1C4]|uniref:Sporulation/spore germination protein n=1 Tax=Symploca sp. SIO1C4 TaxID=2607765 RepID=A0A6B3NAF2_9CYAN|nr:sporulation/spore germination protein [Symploca sp. SIO1C4]NET08527.1 sporulation/spore germination protein [Symploca sp. SIO2B6]